MLNTFFCKPFMLLVNFFIFSFIRLIFKRSTKCLRVTQSSKQASRQATQPKRADTSLLHNESEWKNVARKKGRKWKALLTASITSGRNEWCRLTFANGARSLFDCLGLHLVLITKLPPSWSYVWMAWICSTRGTHTPPHTLSNLNRREFNAAGYSCHLSKSIFFLLLLRLHFLSL